MVDKEQREQLRETFALFIKNKGMRLTPERFAVLDKILDQKGQFEVETIYRAIETEYRVCLATIYNTIELLCECNILQKYHLKDQYTVYSLAGTDQIYIICKGCGAVKTLKDDRFGEIMDHIKFKGFRRQYHSIAVYGYCSKCSRQLKATQKKK